ncbi:hypothetical protein ACFQ08_01445 [Streptosporangium algeriense]|uniref:Uncharacterized protein n=1 Tax=Streptosporangium algeriense TaxID=1682748 RepID=A0ABW3DH84_9ACTN
MNDASSRSTMPTKGTSLTRASFFKWAFVAVLMWGIALFVLVFLVGPIGADQCLTPTGGDVAECASFEAWFRRVSDIWLAVPIGWVLAALFVWLAPRRLSLARRVALLALPALPVASIAALMIVVVRYALVLS